MDKPIPHNIEAEKSVLGSILIDRQGADPAFMILRPEYFYHRSHQLVFEVLCELVDRNEAIDLILVQEELSKKNALDKVGGLEYLAELMEFVPTAAHCEYYAKIVRDKYLLRALIATCNDISQIAFQADDSAEAVIDEAESKFFELTEKRTTATTYTIGEVLKDSFIHLQNLKNRKTALSGMSTGFKDLDSMTNGLEPSQFIVLAARPSMGKTTLALNMILRMALREGKSALFFSLEMSKEQVTTNMLCSYARVDSHKMRKGYLTDQEWKNVGDIMGDLSKARIFIDDCSSLNVMEMRAKARRMKLQEDINIIFIDYMQLIDSRGESRQQEISNISRSLKGLARELNVPIIALSQLSRAVESREDHRPRLSDLRESGAIEQDADIVMMLYREEYYQKEKEKQVDKSKQNCTEVILAKQRNGPTGTVKLTFIANQMRFEDYVGEEYSVMDAT